MNIHSKKTFYKIICKIICNLFYICNNQNFLLSKCQVIHIPQVFMGTL